MLDRLLMVAALAAVALLAGCEDPFASGSKTVPITRPLTVLDDSAAARSDQQAGATDPQTVKKVTLSADPLLPRGQFASDRSVTGGGDKSSTSQPVDIETMVSSQPASGPAQTQTPASNPATLRVGTELVAAAVLQINTRYITTEEIVQLVAKELSEIPASYNEARFTEKAQQIIAVEIRHQITDSLVMTEMQGRLGDDDKKRIDTEMEHVLNEMAAQAGGKKKLEQDLERQGTTLQIVLDDHRRRMTVQAYLHDKIKPAVKITRDMLWAYYTAHKDEYTQPPKVQMRIISQPYGAYWPRGVSTPSSAEQAAARDQAKAQIDKAAAAFADGKDFAAVAKDYSADAKAAEGGLWPMMSAGTYKQKKVEQVAFAMTVGEVSPVIQTDDGYYIVKVAAIEAGRTESFADAQAAIEKKLRDEQESQLTETYIRKLMENSTIIQYDKFQQLAVQRALEKYPRP